MTRRSDLDVVQERAAVAIDRLGFSSDFKIHKENGLNYTQTVKRFRMLGNARHLFNSNPCPPQPPRLSASGPLNRISGLCSSR